MRFPLVRTRPPYHFEEEEGAIAQRISDLIQFAQLMRDEWERLLRNGASPKTLPMHNYLALAATLEAASQDAL